MRQSSEQAQSRAPTNRLGDPWPFLFICCDYRNLRIHFFAVDTRPAMRTTVPSMIAVRAVFFGLVTLLCTAIDGQAQNIMADFTRNVKNYGAKGDGVSDDTQAFLDALNQGRDSQPHFLAAVAVYVPPGTYLIKKTFILWRPTLPFGE